MHKCNKKSFVEKITSTSFSCLQLKHKTSFLHQSPFRWSLIPWRLFRPIKSTFEQNCPSTQIGILYQHQEHKNMRQTVNDAFLFAKLHFIHVFFIFHLFGNIPSQSVELNLWSGVHQILTAMLRKSDVTWWPHLQGKAIGKISSAYPYKVSDRPLSNLGELRVKQEVYRESDDNERLYSCWCTKTGGFEKDYVTCSYASKCACSLQRWYRYQWLLRFLVDEQKMIQNRNVWAQIF